MSLTTRCLGNGGRLGNQLFHYASLIGMSLKYGHALKLPAWDYAQYFDANFPEGESKGFEYQETTFHYNEDYVNWLRDIDRDYDLKGYFQSEKYFEHCKDAVRKALTFKQDFIDQVTVQYDDLSETIAISIRRGDYVGNPNYHYLPVQHYIHALFEHFPDWMNRHIIIFSDDIPYCRVQFGSLPNIHFSENNSDIEDLCLLSQCKHFIVANSTFSWWGAWLGEKAGSKIIRSTYHFEGNLKLKMDCKDYYPERFIKFDYSGRKINLRDVTFTIPVYFDHQDRKKNLNLSVCLIQHYFDTNIIVMENRSRQFGYMAEYTDYYETSHPVFHRTKMLNDMAKEAKTDIIVNWDADVIITPLQILQAVQKIRNGADMVFPYDGRFARIPRNVWFQKIEHFLDIGIIGDTQFNGMMPNDNHNSVGGAVIWNRKRFLEAGGENENFISFGAEDQERVVRAEKLGYTIDRVPGCLYHMSHWVGVDSSTRNPYFIRNREEFEKVKGMSKEELQEYIKSWD